MPGPPDISNNSTILVAIPLFQHVYPLSPPLGPNQNSVLTNLYPLKPHYNGVPTNLYPLSPKTPIKMVYSPLHNPR